MLAPRHSAEQRGQARPAGAPAGLRSPPVPISRREVEKVGQITSTVTSQERKLARGRFPERGKPC